MGRVYDSGTWTKFGIDSERTRVEKVGKGAEITHVVVLGQRSCPSQDAPSLPLRVLPHLAIGPTPAAKLALGAGWHPHQAGPPSPSARAALFDPAFCAHSFSRRVRASVPREGPEIGAKTAPPPGIRSPTAGLGKVGAGAALWGGGVARVWRQDGSQDRPPSPNWVVQTRQGYGLWLGSAGPTPGTPRAWRFRGSYCSSQVP